MSGAILHVYLSLLNVGQSDFLADLPEVNTWEIIFVKENEEREVKHVDKTDELSHEETVFS